MSILTPEYLTSTKFNWVKSTREVDYYNDPEGNTLTVIDPDEGPAGRYFILNEGKDTEEELLFGAISDTEQVIAIAVKFF